MKYTDINRRFTEITNEYLAKGYTFNTSTMTGSQGAKAYVDLTDGTTIIRILVRNFGDYGTGHEGVEIIVGENGSKWVEANTYNDHGTIWDSELKVIYTERYYKLGDNKETREPFYGTEQEADTAIEHRKNHWNAKGTRRTSTTLPLEGRRLEIARSVIQKRLGIKRVSNSDIKLSKVANGYCILYRNERLNLR